MNRLDLAPVWEPDERVRRTCRLARMMARLGHDDYDAFHAATLADPDRYWREALAEAGIAFDAPFERVCDLSAGPQWPAWFPGGRFNLAGAILRAADDPAISGRLAVVSMAEDGREERLDYRTLADEIRRARGRLAALGIGRGDRVGVLLANVPLATVLLLALASLGAVAVPLYSGFGPEPAATRLRASGARTLVATTGFRRNLRAVDLGPLLSHLQRVLPETEVVAVEADGFPAAPGLARWQETPEAAAPPVPDTDPNDPLMILFTSGTTGRPKGTVHTHGGFPIRIALDLAFLFDVEPADRFLWYSDMGWMIGPMSVVGPLLLGATQVLFDGAPFGVARHSLLDAAERHRVTHLGFSPTLVRQLAAEPERRIPPLPDLRVMMTAGETIDTASFVWLHERVGRGRLPIVNYTGGTEVSGALLTNVLVRPISPGTFNAVPPGVAMAVHSASGRAAAGEVGELVLEAPCPGITRGLWNDPDRYIESYWTKRPGLWSHGDLAVTNGRTFELLGRADDVIKVSGRRIGPSEVEDAAAAVPGVRALAAVGVPDALTGEALVVVVVVSAPALSPAAIGAAIEARLGKGYRPAAVVPVADLPRTRNGKIVRRAIRDRLLGRPVGDLSGVENPEAIDRLPVLDRPAG